MIVATAVSLGMQKRLRKARLMPSRPTQNVGTYVGLIFSGRPFIVQNHHDKRIDWCPEEDSNLHDLAIAST